MIQSRFEILETLSRRNSVQTYKCLDAEFGVIVLKVFESVSEQQKFQLQHFSKSLARVSHPGLQEHLGIFEDGEQVSLAFRWIEGLTLAQEIARGVRYSDEKLFGFMEQALEALAVAHGQNPALIHRDIKPENIVHTSDKWVLIDFGASREAVLGDGEVSVIGTTGYAAPEQFFGQAFPTSDQYGLAATTLHLATHRHPTDFPLRKLKLEIDQAGLSLGLEKVLDRMLAPDPKERFLDVETALKAVLSGAGMEDWEFALEPIADTQTVLSAQPNGDEVEIMIGARSNKLYLFLSVMALIALPVSSALFLAFNGFELSDSYLLLGMTFVATGLFVLPIIRREWFGSRVWLLTLTPTGFRLERNGNLFYEGSRPTELTLSRGLLLEMMDRGLDRRAPVKLRHEGGVSKTFGHSMNANESEVLQEVVDSYYRPLRAEPVKQIQADSQALVTTRATDFLQVQKRPNPLRSLAWSLVFVRILPATPKRKAFFQGIPTAARTQFEHHGFKTAGYKKESVLGLPAEEMEVFFSEDGAVALQARPGVFGESDSDFTYYLSSVTDDGRYRLTWSHRNPNTQSSGLVVSVGSKGSFEKDLEAHRAWLMEVAERHGANPIQILSMEDKIAATKYYSLHVESVKTSLIILTMGLSVISMPVMLIWMIFMSI